MEKDLYVIPIDDLREHEESRDCWCQPFLSVEHGKDEVTVVHNSMDGRELIERHGLQ